VSPIVPGAQVSQADQEEIKALRARLGPAKSLETIDTFAKWMFSSVAVVGTLGTAFSLLQLDSLSDNAQTLFALAVVLAGVSLTLAALVAAPQAGNYNPNSLTSMRAALTRGLRRRFYLITAAALTFATAILLASLAPILSTKAGSGRTLHGYSYALTPDGKFTVTYNLSRAKPFTRARISASMSAPVAGRGPPRSVVAVDSRGRGTLALQSATGPRTRRVVVTTRWTNRKGAVIKSRLVVPVKRRAGK